MPDLFCYGLIHLNTAVVDSIILQIVVDSTNLLSRGKKSINRPSLMVQVQPG